MGYLEKKQGLDPGEYSTAFLKIDAESGPWLSEVQEKSPVATGGFSDWDLDLDNGVIRFGDGEQVAMEAQVELLGSYSPDDKIWLWAWSNPKWETLTQRAAQLRQINEEVPELTEPNYTCTETKSWSVAAAAAYLLQAQGCYRLPGEDVQLFVALFDVTGVLTKGQEADPEAAKEALATYAGPMVMNLGGLLLDSVKKEAVEMDVVLAAIHQFCDNLSQLAESPLGKGTPAAAEAMQISMSLRSRAMYLSVPPGSPMMLQTAEELLGTFKELAQHYGAWPEESGTDSEPEERS